MSQVLIETIFQEIAMHENEINVMLADISEKQMEITRLSIKIDEAMSRIRHLRGQHGNTDASNFEPTSKD